jgi:glycosyltransferase involved in cell wall biosynthesis
MNLEGSAKDNHIKTLSVVIPALDEEDGIVEIMARVLAVGPALAAVGIPNLELIIVDDGSTDRTPEIVEAFDGACLVQHPHNKGYGAALKTGFQVATGELLSFLDADGTYPPEHFPELCQEILHNGADVVVGSRRSGAKSEMPMMRRLGNFIWSNLLTLIASQRVSDPASGMRVFRREVLECIYPLPDGLNFTPVMSTRSAHEGIKVVEVPIPYTERIGRSKLNIVKDGIRFLQTILWTALTYNPVRILGGIGLVLIGLAVLIALVLVGMRISGVTALGPLGVASSFAALVLGIGGVNIYAMGIIFNYLVSLFHKRPIHQGMFKRPSLFSFTDRQFWWLGLLGLFTGTVIGVVSFALGMNGWPIERLWLYLLASTMLVLVGSQLFVFWIIARVLEELSQRDLDVQKDLTAC